MSMRLCPKRRGQDKLSLKMGTGKNSCQSQGNRDQYNLLWIKDRCMNKMLCPTRRGQCRLSLKMGTGMNSLQNRDSKDQNSKTQIKNISMSMGSYLSIKAKHSLNWSCYKCWFRYCYSCKYHYSIPILLNSSLFVCIHIGIFQYLKFQVGYKL